MTTKETMTTQIMKAVEEATSSLFDEIDELQKQKDDLTTQVAYLENTNKGLRSETDVLKQTVIEHQERIAVQEEQVRILKNTIDVVEDILKQIHELTTRN